MNAQVAASHTAPTLVSPLEGTRFDLRVRDLVGELVVRQRYVNRRAEPIEALFTFPMAMDATFLGMDVRIGDKVMSGAIAARQEARGRYEEAVARGDAGILLERHSADLYTANLGNVNPGESVELSIRFGMLLRPADGQLRLRLPTTIAPRYGRSPLEPQDEPEPSLFIEHRFALDASIDGLLARAEVSCPTHACVVGRQGEGTSLSICGDSAFLDRDVVIRFDGVRVPPLSACTAMFDDRSVVLAAVHVAPAETKARQPLSVAIVVDCSGSMLGDSIRLARQGLVAALGELGEGDRFTILRFGSRPDRVFDALVPAVETNLRRAQLALAGMDADLGGTEMGVALEAALDALEGESGERMVYLLSDGETHAAQIDVVVRRALQRGIRMFTVGVGAAPVEAVMRPLAERTFGIAEYVAPGEVMAPRIERHFARMRRGSAGRISIAGAATWDWTVVPSCVGAGETVWVAGERSGSADESFAIRIGERAPADAACATVSGTDGEVLARLGAALRLAEPPGAAFDPAGFALRYRLLTSDTACVLVVPRAEGDRAEVLPATVKVPQMLAAGWGGSARVPGADDYDARVVFSYSAHRESAMGAESRSLGAPPGTDDRMEYLDDTALPDATDSPFERWSKTCQDLSSDPALQLLADAVSALGYDIGDEGAFVAWLHVIEAEGLLSWRRLRGLRTRAALRRLARASIPDAQLVAAIKAAVPDRGLHARLLDHLVVLTG